MVENSIWIILGEEIPDFLNEELIMTSRKTGVIYNVGNYIFDKQSLKYIWHTFVVMFFPVKHDCIPKAIIYFAFEFQFYIS